MNKLKTVLFVILLAVLVDFALENRSSTQDLKLFGFTLGQAPTYLLAYASVAVGLVLGWVGHAFRAEKHNGAGPPEAPAREEPPEPGPQMPGQDS